MNQEEVTVQIRDNGSVSIQSPGAQNNVAEIKETLETALKALEKEPDEKHINELVYKK